MISIAEGHVDIAELLIKGGSDPEYIARTQNQSLSSSSLPDNKDENTPPTARHLALSSTNPEIVAIFDPKKAQEMQQQYETTLQLSMLFESAVQGNREAANKSLESIQDRDIKDHNGWSPLMHAVANGHVEVAALMYKAGFEVNTPQGKEKFTPIMAAAANDDVDMVNFLIKAGADLLATEENGLTAADIAYAMGNMSVLKILKPDKYRKDIFSSARTGDIGSLLEFINNESLVNSQDIEEWTPLMHAVANRELKAAILMLNKYDSKLTKFVNSKDESALTIAVINNDQEMAELLLEHGAPIEQRIAGKLYLHELARQQGHKKLSEHLKKRLHQITITMQREMLISGFDVGRPDGIAGKKTTAAFNKIRDEKLTPLNITHATYNDVINNLSNDREPGYVFVCNVSNINKSSVSIAIGKPINTARGWWNTKKNSCLSEWLIPNIEVYIYSDELKQGRETRKICAPHNGFSHHINAENCKPNEFYNFTRYTMRDKKPLVVWLEGK